MIISCRLVSLNLIHLLDIHVPKARAQRIKYIPKKYKSRVLIHKIRNPADHPTIPHFIITNATPNIKSAAGSIHIKNFFRENNLDFMIYQSGIRLAMIARMTNSRFARDPSMSL